MPSCHIHSGGLTLLFLVRTSTGRLPNRRPWHTGGVDSHDRTTDLDLEILDLLREGPRSAYRLARKLAQEGEKTDTEAVRSRLVTLASRGLVVGTPFAG